MLFIECMLFSLKLPKRVHSIIRIMISLPIRVFIYLLFSWHISLTSSYDNISYNGNLKKNLVKREDESEETIEVKIMKKLERLRKTIPLGNPKSNIPIFDPFYIQNVTFDQDYQNLRLKGLVKDINIYGLKYFYVDKLILHLFPVELDLDITLPSLQISSGNYNLKAKLYKLIPLFGEGQFLIKGSAKLKTFLKLSIKEKFIKILDFGLEPSLNEFSFKATGIFGNKLISKFFSEIVTAFVPKAFKMLQKYVTKRLSSIGLEVAKHIFGEITVREVLHILASNDDGLLN